MENALLDGTKILFTGDSITESGRRSDLAQDLGFGFVQIFSDMLTTRNPEKNISIVNTGIGGNTINHLLTRCHDDIIEYAPDVVVILIGINDATRFMDRSTSLHAGVDDFKKIYIELIDEIKNSLPNCQIVLVEPFYLSRGKHINGSYREKLKFLLNNYNKVIGDISSIYKFKLIPLSYHFTALMKFKLSSTFSGDKIHPNRVGHFVIAELIYDSLKG